MSSLPATAERALPSSAGALTLSMLGAVVGRAVAKLEQKAAEWAEASADAAGKGDASAGVSTELAHKGLEKVEDVAQNAGAAPKAGVGAAVAALRGKNPLWAAVKTAWRAGPPGVRAVMITAAVVAILLLVLSPVLLLVLLLSVPIIAAVHRARAD